MSTLKYSTQVALKVRRIHWDHNVIHTIVCQLIQQALTWANKVLCIKISIKLDSVNNMPTVTSDKWVNACIYVLCIRTSYHMATRALNNYLSPEGDKLAKRPRDHVITGLLQRRNRSLQNQCASVSKK